MITGEQLSAYVAGELDADERQAVEAALERDAELRARLERLRASEEMLRSLPDVEPPHGFSERLHGALDRELQGGADVAGADDELAGRRRRRFEAFRPLAVAAAAAAVIALFGVAGTWLLQGGGDGAVDTAQAPAEGGGAALSGVPVVETDNDYDEQELRRLAVNVEVSQHVPRDLTADEATPLADELQGQLLDRTSDAAEVAPDSGVEGEEDAQDGAATAEGLTTSQSRREAVGDGDDVVARCLPTVLEDARSPLIPVHVELARFDGEPAVIYTLAAEDPDSGTYRRVEVWALARSDCQVLSFAQYDRE